MVGIDQGNFSTPDMGTDPASGGRVTYKAETMFPSASPRGQQSASPPGRLSTAGFVESPIAAPRRRSVTEPDLHAAIRAKKSEVFAGLQELFPVPEGEILQGGD